MRQDQLVNAGNGPRAHPPWRMYFPPNPPPLGVPLNLAPVDYDRGAPPDLLRGEELEPYYAPLSTRLIEPDERIDKGTKRRLEAYQKARAQLLADLRRTVFALLPGDRAARRAGFSALAQAQQTKVRALEAQAEKLRAGLAWGVGWSDLRRWQLGRDELNRPRPENQVLEVQLLRAAVFYQEGLSPAQRRVLREAVLIMEDTVYRGADARASLGLFPFFSPDLARVPLPPDLPPEIAAAFAQYQIEKGALRREIQDAIYAGDGVTDRARTRALHRLAEKQAERFTALEGLADAIREKLAPLPASWRRAPPHLLPPGLENQIGDYLEGRRRVQRECEAYLQTTVAGRPPAGIQNDAAALEAWQEKRRTEIEAARDQFVADHADEVEAMNQRCHTINGQLVPYLHRDELPLEGDPVDASLLAFLPRYRQEVAYFEFAIAVFEPGLSPEQRRLLFAGAVAQLELPVAGPDRQAGEAPKTLLR